MANCISDFSTNKKYSSINAEHKWQKRWDDLQLYKWSTNCTRSDVFSIDTPPPTVSGILHMGHIFSYTQTDFIARYQRMKGKNVFYPIGFDNNGLPTERLVEKLHNIKAKNCGREEFESLCKDVIENYLEKFRQLFRSIALSVDWNYEYQTISDTTRKLSQMSFLDLYHKGHAIKKMSPTFWDSLDRTAISQAEIEDKEKNSTMNHILFSTESGKEITIATTRPEMLFACVAVLYHPDDDRYENLSTEKAIVPLSDKSVPIIQDNSVSIEKGTGLVMCCTFGDIQDVEWWRKHSFETMVVIDLEGKMINSSTLNGLYIKDARKKAIELLKGSNLLIDQIDIKQSVKCAERSSMILELIPTEQWYIETIKHKDLLLSKASECKWYPDYMRHRLESWINNLNQDWCISRQRYFGVPFPVWYSKRRGEEGKIITADPDQLPIDPTQSLPKGYRADEVTAESDIMDTWATSSISPQLSSLHITSDYKLQNNIHDKIFPFDLRPQAHEIIRTWAFSTVVKSALHENSIPWHNLMISGWCLADAKNKMSKSKGNATDPMTLLQKEGADVIRYWASNSKLGADIIYNEEAFKIAKKLINKLWNAAKFSSMHINKLRDKPLTSITDEVQQQNIHCTLDLWLLSELHNTIQQATNEFEKFEYGTARSIIESFFWNCFCDNYLELIKKRIYDESSYKIESQSATRTVYHCLSSLLHLFAPFIPHVTDEIYNGVFFPIDAQFDPQAKCENYSTHIRGSWPKINQHYFNNAALTKGRHVIQFTDLIRKFKSDHKLALNHQLTKITLFSDHTEYHQLDDSSLGDIKQSSNTTDICHSDDSVINAAISSRCNKYGVTIIA